MLCAITGIKKLPVVVVATRTTSLSVLQLEVAAGTYRTDKTTRGMAMVSSLDARLVVKIIVAISTDRSVSIEPLFHIGERRHIFLDAQLFANSLLFGVYVSIKFGNDMGPLYRYGSNISSSTRLTRTQRNPEASCTATPLSSGV